MNVLIEMFCLSAVDKAYKLLLDQEQKKRALDVIQAGKEYVEHVVSIACGSQPVIQGERCDLLQLASVCILLRLKIIYV